LAAIGKDERTRVSAANHVVIFEQLTERSCEPREPLQ
jgi:hypothetical protein